MNAYYGLNLSKKTPLKDAKEFDQILHDAATFVKREETATVEE